MAQEGPYGESTRGDAPGRTSWQQVDPPSLQKWYVKNMTLESKNLNHKSAVLSLMTLSVFTLFAITGCTRPEPPQPEAQKAVPGSQAEQAKPSAIAKLKLYLGEGSQEIALAPDSKLKMEVGDAQQLRSVAVDASQKQRDDVSITWASENPDAATVDPRGTLTAVGPGKTTITAFADGQSATFVADVMPLKIAKLEIKSPTNTITVGETLQLDLMATDIKNRMHKNVTAEWKSNNERAAQINNSGLVTAVNPGGATFKATIDGKTAAIKMTVVLPPLARLEIQPSTAAITTGETKQFEAMGLDAKNQERKNLNISWKTDPPQVATITNNGLLSAMKAGSVVVTATAEGKTASALVTVTAPSAPKVEARLPEEPPKETKPLSKKDQLRAKYKDVDPSELLFLSDITGEVAGKGDPTSVAGEAEQAGLAQHPIALDLADLPKDRYGLVDWATAIKTGKVKPRHTLDPKSGPDEVPFTLDVVIFTKSKTQPDVVFPHAVHTMWLTCTNCHPAIFPMNAKEANKMMTMPKIAAGDFCGRCHNRIAFPLSDCLRCHVKPKDQPPVDPDPQFRPLTATTSSP